MMSNELVDKVLNSYVQEIGSGAGKTIRAWTPAEIELAEYAAELRAENARLTAGIARIANDYYSDGGDTAELALSEMREALSGLLEGGE